MERTVTSVKDHLNNLTTWKPDQKVLKVLEGTCFYTFAMLHEHQHILRHHVPMIQAIANCYEPEKRVFKFGGDELLFSLEDIVYITGLPVDAEPVTGYDGNHKRFCEDLLGKYDELLGKNGKSKRSGSVKLSLLRKNFAVLPNKDLGKEELMPYVRAYVLYIIGSVILPDKSGNYVPIMYLQLLKNQEDFNKYAWGAALLCHLHRCFDNFLKDSKCLAGSTFSLMLFAIERVPRLGLYVMGKQQPTEQELQKIFDTRPKDFPLLQGWASKLHPFSNNNHERRDADPIVDILKNLQPCDICWDPYTRLDADFLPQHLKGQQHMGLLHTILLCFEKAIYHRPERCPKQFGVGLVKRPKRRDLEIIAYNRGHAKDWSKFKKMKKYTAIWQGRRDSFIAHPPIPASSSHEDMDVDAGGSSNSSSRDDMDTQEQESAPFTFQEHSPLLFHKGVFCCPAPEARHRMRNQLFDEEAVILTSPSIKDSLEHTTDIRRTKRLCPSSLLGVWRLNNRLKKENVFFDPIIFGLSLNQPQVAQPHPEPSVLSTSAPIEHIPAASPAHSQLYEPSHVVSPKFLKSYEKEGKQKRQPKESSAAQPQPKEQREGEEEEQEEKEEEEAAKAKAKRKARAKAKAKPLVFREYNTRSRKKPEEQREGEEEEPEEKEEEEPKEQREGEEEEQEEKEEEEAAKAKEEAKAKAKAKAKPLVFCEYNTRSRKKPEEQREGEEEEQEEKEEEEEEEATKAKAKAKAKPLVFREYNTRSRKKPKEGV